MGLILIVFEFYAFYHRGPKKSVIEWGTDGQKNQYTENQQHIKRLAIVVNETIKTRV